MTKDGKIKLVDFGLVHQFSSKMTDPNTTLGTVDFMPPEQSVDPSSVGVRADIYSLGATLLAADRRTGVPAYFVADGGRETNPRESAPTLAFSPT